MAINTAHWEFRNDKTIRYIGGDHGTATASYASVLELHRLAQDLADNAGQTNDDYLDITVVNPTDKKFDTIITLTNGWTLDDAYTTPASEFIYGGSIIQGSGGTEAIYDGISVVANRGVIVNVIQGVAGVSTVLTNKFWNTVPDGETFAGINADPANGVAMRFMVKVKDAGSFIDNGALIFTTREWGKSFSEFRIPSTGRGVNVVPLTYTDDLNNTTASGTVATWTTITNVTPGYNLIDVNQDTTNEEYYSEWNRATYTINQFYERMKYITRNGETGTMYGIAGELFRGITHSVAYSAMAGGEFTEGAVVTWGTGATAGTGQVLANDTVDDILYIQLMTGVVPNANQISQTGGKTATAGTVTERALSAPFCGQSTGSSLVGAYGFSLEFVDLAVSDKITALDGTTRQPPNNVTFTVSGVKYGWRVLVAPYSGGNIQYDQLSNSGLVNGAAVTTITVTEAIPANTPSTGTIRIQRADGSYSRHEFSARSGSGPSTFTIASHDFSTNTVADGANVFISYIDGEAPDPGGGTIGVTDSPMSFSTIQSGGNQTLYVEARFGGTGDYSNSIKPAKTSGVLGTTGGSATVSSVSDA